MRILAGARAGLARAAGDLLAFALPQRCAGCGGPGHASRVLCARCAARVPVLSVVLCARCLVRERPPAGCTVHPGLGVAAPWLYDAGAAEVVRALKFAARPGVAEPLGRTLARALPAGWRRPDLVCPVPLHLARRRERGYDQAEQLARALARRTGSPCLPGLLVRERATAAQTGLGARERRANVRGAFRVADPAVAAGRRVLVVDDVLTTGATFEAALGVLRAAGAETLGVALAWAA